MPQHPQRPASRPIVRWLSAAAGKTRSTLFFLVLAQSALALCGVGYALVLRALIDAAAAGSREAFFRAAAALLALIAGQIALRALTRYLEEFSRSTLENRLKSRLFQTLLQKDYAAVTAVHTGEWLNRLTSDTVVVADALTQVLPGATGMLVRLAAAAALLLSLEPRLALLVLPCGAAILVFSGTYRKKLKRLHRDIQEADGETRVFLQENLAGLLVVRLFGRESAAAERAGAFMERHRAARLRRSAFSNRCNVGFSAAMQGLMLLGVLYGGFGILTGAMSYGSFAAIQQLITQIQGPFANLTSFLPRIYAMLASAERLREAESFPDDCEGDALPESETRRFYREELRAVALRGAAFAYPARPGDAAPPRVLDGLDLTIEKGEYLALTGPSGCGKSTVLKLLMSLYPLAEGERVLCTAHGEQPLTGEWRSLFSYVPQGNRVWSGTIRESVAFADGTAAGDDERIRRALRAACAEEFVDALEQGLDTPLGENGAGLSEGQLQRLAIARAVFSERPVLLLDEATSALDEQTEAQLLRNLRAMTDCTVVIVTHRPAALAIVDKTAALAPPEAREEG